MRTFVALNLPAEERARLHAALEPLRARALPIRWTAADALHLTLKFLGEIEGAAVNRIDTALRAVAAQHAPLTLRPGGVGAFPAIRRASIVWVGIEPDSALLALQRDLELALSRLGYAREQKPFRPHITVGRTRGSARAPDIERHASELRYESQVRVATLDLMRSHVGANGSRYEALLRRTLGETPETEVNG
ncbi:MAG TPA: RNA 2',3'-cyclic phosphodiesterase [Longimicrobiales bacterium]|nr:RNA 2',3'-cyclic phosphodiesterase [Longimicrobiales bacterium]